MSWVGNSIPFERFQSVDMRVGRIIEVTPFDRASVPTYKLRIDFGTDIGIRQSSARFRADYAEQELLGQLCVAVVNFAPRNIAGFISEVLVLGAPREGGGIVLIRPDTGAVVGGRIY